MQDVKQERESQLQELARQQECAPHCLSEREALQLASQHSVSRALLLLSQQLSASATV
jgi:hypothetical protein